MRRGGGGGQRIRPKILKKGKIGDGRKKRHERFRAGYAPPGWLLLGKNGRRINLVDSGGKRFLRVVLFRMNKLIDSMRSRDPGLVVKRRSPI